MTKLNQDPINNLNTPMTSEEREVIKSLPTKDNPELAGFTAEFYQTFNMQILHKLFHKIET